MGGSCASLSSPRSLVGPIRTHARHEAPQQNNCSVCMLLNNMIKTTTTVHSSTHPAFISLNGVKQVMKVCVPFLYKGGGKWVCGRGRIEVDNLRMRDIKNKK